jgi:hypothetical protein
MHRLKGCVCGGHATRACVYVGREWAVAWRGGGGRGRARLRSACVWCARRSASAVRGLAPGGASAPEQSAASRAHVAARAMDHGRATRRETGRPGPRIVPLAEPCRAYVAPNRASRAYMPTGHSKDRDAPTTRNIELRGRGRAGVLSLRLAYARSYSRNRSGYTTYPGHRTRGPTKRIKVYTTS